MSILPRLSLFCILLWIPSIHSQCLYASDTTCSSQQVNLGIHSTASSCAEATALNSECGNYFMFSDAYPSWGCRCCSPNGGQDGGSSHSLWDLYDAEGCGYTRVPTSSPTETSAPTPSPTNSCYDYNRGGCWNLGFVDYKNSDSDCQRYCALIPGCNYWSYHPLRGDRRCHLCSLDQDWCTCDEAGSCIWGPATCPGDDSQNATTMFYDAVNTAKSFCSNSGNVSYVTSDDMLIAAETLNQLVTDFDTYFIDINILNEATNTSADVLSDSECMDRLSACDYSGVLMLQLRGFLLLWDDHSDRAFPDSTNRRKQIWDDYRVLVADNEFFDETSLNAIDRFFNDLPSHLLSDGVLFEAPFATMTVRNAFQCGDDSSADSILGFTDRGFNTFQTQTGAALENAFPSDTDAVYGDLMMTVLRHESAHQFDRVVDADDRLLALETLLRNKSDSDDDYLRSQVGHDYFVSAPQEIIASQVGNQYFLDTAAQLRLAIDRFTTTPLPLSWMIWFFDIIGGSNSSETVFYKEQNKTTGYTETAIAWIERDEKDRVVGLRVPGCDSFEFQYGTNGLVAAYSGPSDCVVDFDKNLTTLSPTISTTNETQDDSTTTTLSSPTYVPSTSTSTTKTKLTNVSSEHCLYASDTECASQGINLGVHATIESCAIDAAQTTMCGDYFMFSESYYTSWGCRCCAANGGETNGTHNPDWDLFSVEGCGVTRAPTNAPTNLPETTTTTDIDSLHNSTSIPIATQSPTVNPTAEPTFEISKVSSEATETTMSTEETEIDSNPNENISGSLDLKGSMYRVMVMVVFLWLCYW